MQFKQWINESVTFTIKDYSKQKIDDISHLAYMIDSALRRSLGAAYNTEGFKYSRLDMDGGDTWKQEGTLNFYAGGMPEEAIKKALAAVQYFVKEHDAVVTGPIRKETSKMFKVPVYRIPVKLAPDNTQAPEMNVSNSNARMILQDLLNLPSDELYGSISAQELLMKIGGISDFNKQMMLQAPSVDKGKGATIYHGGVDEDQIERYLSTLEKMARWAMENDYNEIQWG
jgi:hypothetical protein